MLKVVNGCPANIDPRYWDYLIELTFNAIGNTCDGEGSVDLQELSRFEQELEDHTSGNISVDTLEWIWSRLPDIGPAGKSHVARFGDEFHNAIKDGNLKRRVAIEE